MSDQNSERKGMAAEEFASLMRTTFGDEWQGKAARLLNLNPRRLRQWMADGWVPIDVSAEMQATMGQTAAGAAPWPQPKWILGEGMLADGELHEYLMHTGAPRFVARVVSMGEDDTPEAPDQDADLLSGIVAGGPGFVLCETVWIDPPPAREGLEALFQEATEAASDLMDALVDRASADMGDDE